MKLPAPFGPYLLLQRIGSGGMAEVFLASARGIGGFEKLLCIKFIRREHADNKSFVAMLIEEAKIVSEVVHPNVAQVFDLGKVDGQYYIAMEYVHGVDVFAVLQAAAERGVHLPVPAAALIVRDVAAGLGATHGDSAVTGRSLGIVHRDVSPHNLLVSYDGEVKIIDFGVAKASLNMQQTDAGVIKGKYNYMSPEQAAGKPIDHRTDIFSTGIVLWELLAGEPLYPGENIARVLAQARKAKVAPIKRRRGDVPRSIQAVLKRALEKKPDRRYRTMAELQTDLDEYLRKEAAGYGRRDLAELLAWLLPDREPADRSPPGSTDGIPRMQVSDYVSVNEISIVSAPGVPRVDTMNAPAPSSSELDAAPTRVASREEILERRRARQAGLKVPPVPLAQTGRQRPRRWGLLGAGAGLAVALAAVLALWLGVAPEPSAVLDIRSKPEGAEVWLDDQPTGIRTPGRLIRGLAPGERHRVRLHLRGYRPWEEPVDLTEGETHLNVRLRPLSASLWIRSRPSGAQVLVGGEPRGRTPLELTHLDPSRPLPLEVRHEGYESRELVHRWNGRHIASVNVELTPLGVPEDAGP